MRYINPIIIIIIINYYLFKPQTDRVQFVFNGAFMCKVTHMLATDREE